MTRLTRVAVILSLIAGSFLKLPDLCASEYATVTVSPVSQSSMLHREETKEIIYTALNESGRTQHVIVQPRQWFMPDINKDIAVDSWLRMEPSEFYISPGETKKIIAHVSVPDEASGELAAMIAFRPVPEEKQAINIVFSTSLYVLVRDTQVIDCKIADFKLAKAENEKTLNVEILLKNDGNMHLRPEIDFIIQDMLGKNNLKKVMLNYNKPVYPEESQYYSKGFYNFMLKPGIYRMKIKIEFINVATKMQKNIYFLVGRNGKILFTFFRRSM